MKRKTKLLSMLALLLMAATGAWAQTYNVKFEANGNTVTKENVTLPHTFSCDYWNEKGELDQIIKQLYGLGSGYCYDNSTPSASGNSNVTAGNNDSNHYITISAPFEGTATVRGEYSDYSNMINYSLTISLTVASDVATVALNETTDNTSTLESNDGKKANVTLTRTLQTGGWNTFCVPFDLATPTGWTVKKLTASEFNSSTGELTMTFADAASIEAGKPYLVKVTSTVENPTFEGVTINNSTTTTETACIDFVPVMNPTSLTGGDKTVLFVTGGNKLTYPTADGNINGLRAYFHLKGDAVAEARAFRMSFDDDATGIVTVLSDEPTTASGIYTLDGRRLPSQTAAKGVYIMNGKKTIIK